MKIVTHHDRLPIEERLFDWTATMDNYQPGEPVGKGDTEKAAIDDLLAQIDLKDYEALGMVDLSHEDEGPPEQNGEGFSHPEAHTPPRPEQEEDGEERRRG